MPKSASGSPKKARWSAAKKAEARKKSRPGTPATKGHKGFRDSGRDEPRTKRPRAERSPRWETDDPRRAGRDPDRGRDRDRGDSRRGAPERRPSQGERHPARRDERGPRVADPARRDRHEGRHVRRDPLDERGSWRGERRDDRPRFEREPRDDRPRFEREPRDDRPRFEREGRDEKPRFERDRREDRPRFEREGREDRPRFERERREDRPRFERERRDDRPRSERERRDDNPRFERRSDRRDDGRRDDRRPARERPERHDPAGAFAAAEAERALADDWTAYRSTARGGPAEVTDDNAFAALGVPERLVERLARDGIVEPFPIQAATIPDALAGRDVLGRGRTGSGKTIAFGLPLIARLAGRDRPASKRPRALILVPTRELAMQVNDALEPYLHVAGLRPRLVAGGLSYEPQITALARGVDVLIATPGRLRDLLERGAVALDDVELAVLDEADHMADMGFLPEVTEILDLVPAGGQRLLFSATLDKGIDTLVERYLVDPVTHSVDEAQATVTTMSHHVLLIDPQDKKTVTAELAGRSGRTIVFVRTQLGGERVARELRERGVLAAALHGGLTQAVRNRVLGAFRENRLPVLVATDVAARGIHVDEVGMVLQVDPPRDHKDYLHRAGRTARAGEEGHVVTLALPHQKKVITRLVEAAGADASVSRARPEDATIAGLGGVRAPGTPVPDELWRPILEGTPRPGRRGGGPGRGGGRRPSGGSSREPGRGAGRSPRAQWRRER